MSTTGSVFSQTLQDITTAKLDELAKKRDSFERDKSQALSDAGSQKDSLSMLAELSSGVKRCFSVQGKDGEVARDDSNHRGVKVDLQNLDRFLEQARFDPSISETIIRQWRNTMLKHLEVQSLKYTYADLYGKLTMEWLSAAKRSEAGPGVDSTDASHDFEKIDARAKMEAKQQWEETVFTAVDVDTLRIQSFLQDLFKGKEATAALNDFKKKLDLFASSLIQPGQINSSSLQWIISGLLKSDLLSEEKRQVLRDFLSNHTIRAEIADVLDMRLTRLESWSWGDAVPVMLRRQVSGVYRIYMHEDLLQAILLHYIGVKWSVFLKSALRDMIRESGVLAHNDRRVTTSEKKAMEWYLGKMARKPNMQAKKSSYYRAGYFVAQLMDKETEDTSVADGEVEAEFGQMRARKQNRAAAYSSDLMAVQEPQPPVPPMSMRMAQGRAMAAAYAPPAPAGLFGSSRHDEEGLIDDESESDTDLDQYKPKNAMHAKQRLLHLLSTDILITTRTKGELTCFRTNYEAWNALLPHDTIQTVLGFFGVSDRWLNFFKTFLTAPLRFMDDQDTTPRPRQRGTPTAHVISDVFGEMVLFCLDFAVAQQTRGEVLWRLNEDVWWWGSHEMGIAAWKTLTRFNKVMGVTLNDSKTGSARFRLKDGSVGAADVGGGLPQGEIRWGMLYLDPQKGHFTIDEDMVTKHTEELRRQLKDKERSIFSWVQAYSTYASVFFTSNFGKPANCFGRQHIDNMLATHTTIQRRLFESFDTRVESVVEWLRQEIQERFHVANVPDGYIFFPTEVGGLEVMNPFVGLLQVRDSVERDPLKALDKFEEAEMEAYQAAKKKFEERKPYEWHDQGRVHNGKDGTTQPEKFLSFEAYTKYRDRLNYGFGNQLVDVYDRFLDSPAEETVDVEDHGNLFRSLTRLGHLNHMKFNADWYSMEPYWRWVVGLYGPDMVEQFGGLSIVEPGLLPMGMVSLFRSGRVQWEE